MAFLLVERETGTLSVMYSQDTTADIPLTAFRPIWSLSENEYDQEAEERIDNADSTHARRQQNWQGMLARGHRQARRGTISASKLIANDVSWYCLVGLYKDRKEENPAKPHVVPME